MICKLGLHLVELNAADPKRVCATCLLPGPINLRSLDQEAIDERSIWCGSFGGYNLAAFEDCNVVYLLVSDLRESASFRRWHRPPSRRDIEGRVIRGPCRIK